MATERIAAKYVYTLEDERPLVDAYVEYDTDAVYKAVKNFISWKGI